jgi:hypothetical protein
MTNPTMTQPAMTKQMTLGVIVDNRNFFPGLLIRQSRNERIR